MDRQRIRPPSDNFPWAVGEYWSVIAIVINLKARVTTEKGWVRVVCLIAKVNNVGGTPEMGAWNDDGRKATVGFSPGVPTIKGFEAQVAAGGGGERVTRPITEVGDTGDACGI